MRLRLLAMLAAFVWVPVAQAATMVWFEAVGAAPFSFVWWQGQGQELQLTYPEAQLGVFSWQVSMKAALGTTGVAGWSLDLRTAPGNNVSLLNPQVVPGPLSNLQSTPGIAGTGPALLQGAGGYGWPPAPSQTLTLLTFTLRRTVVSFGDFTSAHVIGGPSVNSNWVWYNAEADDYAVVQFGPNPPVLAMEGIVGALPLIRIFPFPEPSSLTLLAFGGAVCLRRWRCANR